MIIRMTMYELWEVELAPSQYISPLPHKKGVCLSLPPPQMLLMSSLTPPTLSSRCSCPEPLLPSQKGEGQPFYSTDWEGSAEKCSGECNLCLLRSQLASTSQLWPGNLHTGFGEVDDQGMGGGGDLAKGATTSPSTSPTDASFLSSFSVLLDALGYIKQLPKHNQDTFFVVCSSFTMLWHQFQLEMWLGLITTYWNSTGWRKALSGAIMNFYMITAVYKNMWNFVLLE